MMDNQHRKISNYRELTQEEINLMNDVKKLEVAVLEMIDRIDEWNIAEADGGNYELLMEADSHRWVLIAKDNLEQGFMALVRAVAKPTRGKTQ